MKQFVDVVLPLPIPGLFTYSFNEADVEHLKIGVRVIVPFGKKKYYTAIVVKLHTNAPVGYTVKPIFSILDDTPILLAEQLKFWNWLSSYYLAALGDVYKAALPSGLKLASETIVELNLDYIGTPDLTDRETKLLDLLSEDPIQSVTKLIKDSGIENILPIVNKLLERGALMLREELKNNYKPRLETRVRLTSTYQTNEAIEPLFDQLGNAPKQLDLLIKYIDLSRFFAQGDQIGRAHV